MGPRGPPPSPPFVIHPTPGGAVITATSLFLNIRAGDPRLPSRSPPPPGPLCRSPPLVRLRCAGVCRLHHLCLQHRELRVPLDARPHLCGDALDPAGPLPLPKAPALFVPPKGATWGCITREGAPAAVRQAVGGGCQSGWGRLLSVTNAIEAGTWREGDSGWAQDGRFGGGGGGYLPPFQCLPGATAEHAAVCGGGGAVPRVSRGAHRGMRAGAGPGEGHRGVGRNGRGLWVFQGW